LPGTSGIYETLKSFQKYCPHLNVKASSEPFGKNTQIILYDIKIPSKLRGAGDAAHTPQIQAYITYFIHKLGNFPLPMGCMGNPV
jgi:hypothetical protein